MNEMAERSFHIIALIPDGSDAILLLFCAATAEGMNNKHRLVN